MDEIDEDDWQVPSDRLDRVLQTLCALQESQRSIERRLEQLQIAIEGVSERQRNMMIRTRTPFQFAADRSRSFDRFK